MVEKLQLAQELTACLSGIEVQLISDSDGSLHSFLRQSIYGNVLPAFTADALKRMMADMQPECLYILSGILDFYYAVIPTKDCRFLCIGPCMKEEFSENRVRASLRPFRLSAGITKQVVEYCRWRPVLSVEALHRLGVLLCRHVLGIQDWVPHHYIDYQWYPSGQLPVPEMETEAARIHRVEQRYEASAALTEAVRQGNLSLAYTFMQGFHPGISGLIRNANPLRNTQNICIILNTQLRHALEECRVHPYRLDQVSGEIAMYIETLKSPEAASKFCADIIRRYCELSTENRYPHLNRLTRQAVVYIKSHLGDNLTVKETAEALMVNANYLSGVFHRELGVTFIDFINRERVQQAAALLRHTNMQIQRIAALVGYNNTSYFTRQFTRVQGCTPKEYRARSML